MELGHILVAVPEKASPAEIAALQTKAQTALTQLKRGDDLGRVAKEFSNAAERDTGGLMGLRPASRYPSLFVDATKSLNEGEITLVRSGAGFHVLKLITKRASSILTVTQTRPRHICHIAGCGRHHNIVPAPRSRTAQGQHGMQVTERSDSGEDDPHSANPCPSVNQATTPEAVEILAVELTVYCIVIS
jgi:hypothetical protein